MGKPHVPYQTKRLIDACLESLYDFEVLQSPVSLQLSMTDGKYRIDCRWNKKPGTDLQGRETTRYQIEYMTVYPPTGHPTRAGIDEIETIIRTTQRLGKQHETNSERQTGRPRNRDAQPEKGQWPLYDLPVLHPHPQVHGKTLF